MGRIKIVALAFLVILATGAMAHPPLRVPVTPGGQRPVTAELQQAIDSCAQAGGGMVVFQQGIYHCGTLELRSRVTLRLAKGTVLLGSADYRDYRSDAFIYGDSVTGVTITGEGIIDGADCYNPHGEEGFRGPHCIRMVHCSNIRLSGFTIRRSANYALNFRWCRHARIEAISIHGGHDGLHTRFCSDFLVRHCDLRTGDDAFAGNDNEYFTIEDCLVNSSCNCFRLGCLHFTVRHCHLWGPGEYAHRIEGRVRYPTAFVHFSPPDDHPRLVSGDWHISGVTMDSVLYVYFYNNADGLWQNGRPATTISFDHIRATCVSGAFYVIGDSARSLQLQINRCVFLSARRAAADTLFDGVALRSKAFIYARKFGLLRLNRVRLDRVRLNKVRGNDAGLSLDCREGDRLE